jgi:hypothetical protein
MCFVENAASIVYHQLELIGLFGWKVGRLSAFQNLVDMCGKITGHGPNQARYNSQKWKKA